MEFCFNTFVWIHLLRQGCVKLSSKRGWWVFNFTGGSNFHIILQMRFVKPDFIYGCEKIPLSVNTTLNSIVVVNAIDIAPTNIARYIYDIYQRYIYMIYIYDMYDICIWYIRYMPTNIAPTLFSSQTLLSCWEMNLNNFSILENFLIALHLSSCVLTQ